MSKLINKDFVAIIPARQGSKGLKNKNIKKVLGHPLIAYSIKAAKKSNLIKDVYVTTDGKNIAKISKKYGAKIIHRPSNLANSFVISDKAILHAIKIIEKKINFRYVVFLQPTSPLRSKNDIDDAIKLFLKKKADSLFTSVELHSTMWRSINSSVKPYHKSFNIIKSRQNSVKNVIDNGSFFITNKDLFKKFKHRLAGTKIISYEMEKWTMFEIDNKDDFDLVNYLFKFSKVSKKMVLI